MNPPPSETFAEAKGRCVQWHLVEKACGDTVPRKPCFVALPQQPGARWHPPRHSASHAHNSSCLVTHYLPTHLFCFHEVVTNSESQKSVYKHIYNRTYRIHLLPSLNRYNQELMGVKIFKVMHNECITESSCVGEANIRYFAFEITVTFTIVVTTI